MILNEQNKELAMELLCAMTIEDLAKELIGNIDSITKNLTYV